MPLLCCIAETYLVDSSAISVSGLSSGAYFAVQFHVAFSGTINGAGIVAGGTYAQLARTRYLTYLTHRTVLLRAWWRGNSFARVHGNSRPHICNGARGHHIYNSSHWYYRRSEEHCQWQGVPFLWYTWFYRRAWCVSVVYSIPTNVNLHVRSGVVKKLSEYYSAFLAGSGASLMEEFNIPAEHSMVRTPSTLCVCVCVCFGGG